MSVEMEVQFKGQDEFRMKMEQIDASMKTRVQQCLQELADSIKETAKSIAPVRTGYLRSTIFAETADWTVRVGASAPYTAYVEFGTRFMQARRFLARALQANMPSLVKAVNQAIEQAISEVSTR